METVSASSRRAVVQARRFTLLCAGVCFGLCSLILAPIFIRYSTDVAFQDAWWVYILYTLTDGGLLELTAAVLCYPASIYVLWRVGFRRSASVPLTFAGMTLVKYAVNFIFPALTYEGALPDADDFFGFDLPIMLANYGLEMLQFALVLLIAHLVRRSFIRKAWITQAEALEDGEDFLPVDPDTDGLFTFEGLLRLGNPVQLSAFLMAALLSAVRITMHQIYEYTLYLNGGTDGLLIMALDLVGDLFIGVVAYFITLLLLSRFFRKECEGAAD
jgi:hypothetical protein